MDLENEELKATRKLNGVAKESNIDKLIKLKEISKRFNNGTETIEDIMYYCRNYEIKFENGLELRVVEKRYFDKLVEKIKELEEENKKYIIKLTNEEYKRVIDVAQEDIKKQFKQKIKDKIKELKIIQEENADEIKRNVRFYSIYDSYDLQIEELQELLQEEDK